MSMSSLKNQINEVIQEDQNESIRSNTNRSNVREIADQQENSISKLQELIAQRKLAYQKELNASFHDAEPQFVFNDLAEKNAMLGDEETNNTDGLSEIQSISAQIDGIQNILLSLNKMT